MFVKDIFMKSFILKFVFVCLLFSCESNKIFQYPSDNQDKVTITQGVWGNVWFWEGNFQPIIDPDQATITPVVREIFVYEPVHYSTVEHAGVGYDPSSINSNLITTLYSDDDGFYQVELPPGKYSFFAREDTVFYANGMDGEGHILPATVTENNVTKRQIDIDYKAVE